MASVVEPREWTVKTSPSRACQSGYAAASTIAKKRAVWSWQMSRSGAPVSWITAYGAPRVTSACPAEDRLGGEILLGELGQLDVDPALADALERDKQVERLDPLDVAERDVDTALDGSAVRGGAAGCGAAATCPRIFTRAFFCWAARPQDERDHEQPNGGPHGPCPP